MRIAMIDGGVVVQAYERAWLAVRKGRALPWTRQGACPLDPMTGSGDQSAPRTGELW